MSTQTTSGVTVGHVAVFSDVNGNIMDGGAVPTTPYTLPTATSSVLGGVKVDGASIGITSGTLHTVGLSTTIVTAALTTMGTQGSMTFTNGLLTAQTPAT